ncbi:MAG: hypothetical protein WA996_11490 [Candidatus Promineifilaceae bacterium]
MVSTLGTHPSKDKNITKKPVTELRVNPIAKKQYKRVLNTGTRARPMSSGVLSYPEKIRLSDNIAYFF